MKKGQQFLFYFLMFLVIISVFRLFSAPPAEEIKYSRFKQLLAQKQVKDIVITNEQVRGTVKEGGKDKAFVSVRIEDPELIKSLEASGVTYEGRITENWFKDFLLAWILPLAVLVVIWTFVFRRMGGGGPGETIMSFGKSRAKIYGESDVKVTFNDVAGVEEAKEELIEVVEFLKRPDKFTRLGGRIPKGVMLVGPPGTGKTLLARAVAGEAKVPFFSMSGSEFVEMFVGVGASRVRDLFKQAIQKAPCIIFIDELDALGRARGAGIAGGHEEREQTLNQLLAEMDGFDPRKGVIIMAATNRPEILDPALLRAGRFDRQVLVDRPDRVGRKQILQVYLPKISAAGDIDADAIAALTPGFAGADLANLVNEAALVATRRGADRVTMADFSAAIERIVAGLEKKNRLLNPREREIVAYHEMGHALVAAAQPGCDPVHKVSIIPRGIGALGYTIQRPTEDRFLMTKEELLAKMAVLLGGRAAEQVVFGHLSTGAADDLVRTTDIARSMVTRYGMVPELGHIAYDRDRQGFLGAPGGMPVERSYSEQTAQAIDAAVRALVDQAFATAVGILENNRDVLVKSATLLLEKETLDETQLKALLAQA
jgi:cell division protease FtsH